MKWLKRKIGALGKREKTAFFLFLAVFVFCAFWLTAYRVNAGTNERQMADLRRAAFSSSSTAGSAPAAPVATHAESGSSETKPAMVPQFRTLLSKNADIAAWVQIEGTGINYPVMQTPYDPEYYLYRNLGKQHESRGLPFLDAASNLLKSGNYLVYGHNMKDGTAFADLVGYLRKSFYEAHPSIRFDTLYGTGSYRIISVFRTRVYRQQDRVFKYYRYADLETREDFDAYVANVKRMSEYPIDTTAVFGDRLLTLSTCYEYVPDGRLVIVAKKVG